MSILPTPLHPLVVHMPIALTVLVPLFAVGALWTIRRGARPARAWGLSVAMIGALLTSGWVALQTGEGEEEKVERVVNEAAINKHEEAAEVFLFATALVMLVASGGLLKGAVGTASRGIATVGTFALVGAGWNVGHTGGELVYRDGAAAAYADAAAGPRSGSASDGTGRAREADDHERRR